MASFSFSFSSCNSPISSCNFSTSFFKWSFSWITWASEPVIWDRFASFSREATFASNSEFSSLSRWETSLNSFTLALSSSGPSSSSSFCASTRTTFSSRSFFSLASCSTAAFSASFSSKSSSPDSFKVSNSSANSSLALINVFNSFECSSSSIFFSATSCARRSLPSSRRASTSDTRTRLTSSSSCSRFFTSFNSFSAASTFDFNPSFSFFISSFSLFTLSVASPCSLSFSAAISSMCSFALFSSFARRSFSSSSSFNLAIRFSWAAITCSSSSFRWDVALRSSFCAMRAWFHCKKNSNDALARKISTALRHVRDLSWLLRYSIVGKKTRWWVSSRWKPQKSLQYYSLVVRLLIGCEVAAIKYMVSLMNTPTPPKADCLRNNKKIDITCLVIVATTSSSFCAADLSRTPESEKRKQS